MTTSVSKESVCFKAAKAARFASEQQRLYSIHGRENILDDPYYNPNLTRDREDFSESDDLRGLKEGKVTVRFRV